MRIVGEIPHDQCKITLFHWNNRYLVKLERGRLEQTFKIDEFDLTSDKDLLILISSDFIQKAITRFDDMDNSLSLALQNL